MKGSPDRHDANDAYYMLWGWDRYGNTSYGQQRCDTAGEALVLYERLRHLPGIRFSILEGREDGMREICPSTLERLAKGER